MTRRATLVAVAASSLTFATPAHAGESGWRTASDIGRTGLIFTALVLPLAQDDCRLFRRDYDPQKYKCRGFTNAALSLGATSIVTTALKQTIREERPDKSDHESFPSGHTSISFASAATLHKRNGWEVGVPAHIVATFVGVARVKGNKHFVRDVVAGAVIGEAAGWLLTKRKDDKVQWLPWGDAHGGGIIVAMRF